MVRSTPGPALGLPGSTPTREEVPTGSFREETGGPLTGTVETSAYETLNPEPSHIIPTPEKDRDT